MLASALRRAGSSGESAMATVSLAAPRAEAAAAAASDEDAGDEARRLI